jgi:hypothetical protein
VNFRIDARDAIVHAEGPFDGFAGARSVPHLPERWLGEPIWGCVDDEEARAVLAALVARVRGGRIVRLTTRSGARAVAIEIAPVGSGDVEFRCRLDAAPPATPTLPPAIDRLRVCAWCYRAELGGWRDIEDVVASEHLLDRSSVPVITHGICDACLTRTLAHWDASPV